ncbi:MAG TPA: hypothetical protein VKV18_03955 [Chthonomonas sp.]|uniref:hypothetical protein n=1 Tax=Chthonomonas sp. TaxID=2282153 RepID=UPI002B4B3E73|nr:hypothetical protein [Chthonomonas sp.]HLI47829.1 hypothetical protein [Chthonomonas sp.]
MHTKQLIGLAAALLALTLYGSAAKAQGPGGQGGPPPEIMAKIRKWQSWQKQHKNATQLGQELYQLEMLNQQPGYALNKQQSAKLVAILKAWRHKPTMSEEQAHNVLKQIGSLLTVRQIQKMTTLTPPWQRRPGGPGGGPGGPPPGGRPGGPPPGGRFNFPDPPSGGFNPLNPDTLPFPPMRDRAKQGLDSFIATLQTQAKR